MAANAASAIARTADGGINEFWSTIGAPEFSYKASPDPEGAEARQFQPQAAIERLAGLPWPEFERRFLLPGLPVILTDVVGAWPAAQWTLDTFRERSGAEPVSVDTGDGSRQTMRMGDYLDLIEALPPPAPGAPAPPYLRLWHYERSPAAEAYTGDFSVPAVFADWFERLPAQHRPQPPPRWIFVGPPGASTPLHLDPWSTHAWFAQIAGRKRFVLFPPVHTRLVCDGRAFVDPDAPDLERFPQFGAAARLEFELGPGDLLFLPAGWAHAVQSLTHTVSLTHNFLDEAKFKVVRSTFLMWKMKKVMGASLSDELDGASLSDDLDGEEAGEGSDGEEEGEAKEEGAEEEEVLVDNRPGWMPGEQVRQVAVREADPLGLL